MPLETCRPPRLPTDSAEEPGILTPLIKNLTEAALEGELDSHLDQEITANRRKGKSQKTIKSLNGNLE